MNILKGVSMSTTKQKQNIASLIGEADELAERHVAYTEQFVTRANEELYKLLSSMMALSVKVQADKSCDQIIKQMRKRLREEYQVKTQANSPTSSIVVRYVVRTGRKTAHVYGRVIQTAIDAGISAKQLPDFIREKGGIDAIRKAAANSETTKSAASYNKALHKTLSNELLKRCKMPLGVVEFCDGKQHTIGGSADVTFTYLIGVSGYGNACVSRPRSLSLSL